MPLFRGVATWFDTVLDLDPLNPAAVKSERYALAGLAFFVLLFVVVWAPWYIFDIATHALFPLWMPLLLVVWGFAIAGVIAGLVGLRKSHQLSGVGRASGIRGAALCIGLILVAPPVLWFGGSAKPIDVGAGRGSLTLTADEAALPCTNVRPVDVADLASAPTGACEPVGADLVFPDGTRLTLPTGGIGGGSFSPDARTGSTYTYQGVGMYGIYASQSSAGCTEFQEWGSAEAIERVHSAFGMRYGCD